MVEIALLVMGVLAALCLARASGKEKEWEGLVLLLPAMAILVAIGLGVSATGWGQFAKDKGYHALPVGEIIRTLSVERVDYLDAQEKSVSAKSAFETILVLPNGKHKAYRLDQAPPKVFTKMKDGKYVPLPGTEASE